MRTTRFYMNENSHVAAHGPSEGPQPRCRRLARIHSSLGSIGNINHSLNRPSQITVVGLEDHVDNIILHLGEHLLDCRPSTFSMRVINRSNLFHDSPLLCVVSHRGELTRVPGRGGFRPPPRPPLWGGERASATGGKV